MVPRCSKFCGIDVNQRYSKVTGSQSEMKNRPGVIWDTVDTVDTRSPRLLSCSSNTGANAWTKDAKLCRPVSPRLISLKSASGTYSDIDKNNVKLVEGKQNLVN